MKKLAGLMMGLAMLAWSGIGHADVDAGKGNVPDTSSIKQPLPGKAINPAKPGSKKLNAPDPQCPLGTMPVGPMTTSDFSKPCKKDGVNGTMQCTSKFIRCMGEDPNGPNHAYTEACGPCIPNGLPAPGQATTPTGR